jgi:hypothetical protein
MNPDVANELYAQFIVQSGDLLKTDGKLSFITPTSWETGPAYDSIRSFLLNDGSLDILVNLPYDVFEDAYVDTAVFVWHKNSQVGQCSVADLSGTRIDPALVLKTPLCAKFQ